MSLRLIRLLLASLAAVSPLAAATPARADPVFLGPSPYLGFADSPFNAPGFSYFHLENFEDRALNAPGATASPGWLVIGPPRGFDSLIDSVDADDGAINGSGSAGRSFYSGGSRTSLTITFSAAALGGNLPTHVGIVWTDVGAVTSGTIGFGPVTFSATDALGVPLGSIGPFTLGDGAFAGTTAEDRFFGVTHAGGISSITISMSNSVDWEVDHLQYGFIQPTGVIPEPASVALFGTGLAGLAAYRRFRRRAAA
ncbi:MAG TPA: PEP-CTERM sorting domain-containing protein [Gemmataceae bacterium]|nr:PEP-CTERM sorting domain-containing protein [Gemmataceae bacterium]